MAFNEEITGKVATPRADRQRTRLIVAGLALLLVGAAVYGFLQHRELVRLRNDSSRLIQAQLETIALANQQVAALDELATAVDGFNRQFGGEVGHVELNNLEGSIQNLRKQGHLPEDAKRSLDEFRKTAAGIAEMAAKMKEFEQYLGAPVIARKGESHADLARRYLLEQTGLPPREAEEVLRRTALDWEIEPGNQVFNLYHNGILLTSVTQGSARRAPVMVQWARRRAVQKKREALEARVAELEAQLAANQPTPGAPPPSTPAAPGDEKKPPPGTFWVKTADGTTTTVTPARLPAPEPVSPPTAKRTTGPHKR